MAPPRLTRVPIAALPIDRFADVLGESAYAEVQEAASRATKLLDGRVVLNVNSTARGGGVVEMLVSLLAYTRAVGVDTQWVVIDGDPGFFQVTKRLHNRLHGADGDGGPLGDAERGVYEAALAANAPAVADLVQRGDIVVLHDPQTAGLVEPLKERGARVVWRAHIGMDHPNDAARDAWRFLSGYVADADAYVFSREGFAWDTLDDERIHVIAPSIDAFSVKNQDLGETQVRGILGAAGLVADGGGGDPAFTRADGSSGRVDRRAEVVEEQPLGPEDRVVVQVSRWDRLKDPLGVLQGFVSHAAPEHPDCHLLLAGPEVRSVTDDPEGAEVWDEVVACWRSLPDEQRRTVHLACLPMEDVEENAAIVNAVQRNATVVVQKSLAEGFGLTVAEAMWKSRPVVASRIGGIQDQIVEGENGLLVDEPRDLAAFGAAVRSLLDDPERARRIGDAAHRRVVDEFLGPRHLMQYLELFESLRR